MSYVVGNWILDDRSGDRDGHLHRIDGGHGILLHDQGMRMHEVGRAALRTCRVSFFERESADSTRSGRADVEWCSVER